MADPALKTGPRDFKAQRHLRSTLEEGPSFSEREDDQRKPPRAGRVDPGHGHEQDGGDKEGDRGDGGRAQRPPDRRHRRVLLRRVPLDGQHWLRHQEQLEGVSGQLAETIPGIHSNS